MLSYMLPTDEKPPPDSRRNGNFGKEQSARNVSGVYRINDIHHNHHNHHHHHINQHNAAGSAGSPNKMTLNVRIDSANIANANTNLQTTQFFYQRGNCGGGQAIDDIDETDEVDESLQRNGGMIPESPVRHVASVTTKKSSSAFSNNPGYNSTHGRTVVKDDSLYSIGSDASTVGSEKKQKLFNGAKHTSLKR